MRDARTVMRTQTIDLGYEQLLIFRGLPADQVRIQFRGVWLASGAAATDSVRGGGERKK